jgi:hypothetical protein
MGLRTINPITSTGEIMEIETLKIMNAGMYLGLLTMLEAIALITIFFAITGIATCLAGIAWLCFEETRRSISAPRTARCASPPSIWKSAPRASKQVTTADF